MLLPLIQPPQELVDILLPALGPCPAIAGECKGHVRWDPKSGHVPRGYRGATGRLDEVNLVLVCAEPGDAYAGEPYDGLTPLDKLRSAYTHSCWHIEEPRDRFGQNMQEILKIAFPGHSLEQQLRRTWITNAVLCSAPKECGTVSSAVEQECRRRYLLAQLRLFPNASIVALGGKAEQRLRDLPGVKVAYHPAARLSHREMRESWVRALEDLGQSKLEANDARGTSQPSVPLEPQSPVTQASGGSPASLCAEDGWNRTYSNPRLTAQTEFIERALSDVRRTAEEIATIANLICGEPGYVEAGRVTGHLMYHHLTLGASRRKGKKSRMPQLIHSDGRWSVPANG
ncbi:MAG: uracil-DNA glycosylase family protein [Gemmataceae bacterium]|nr:uracil-DNA glycosylase family protein [Gemmataceae bacterium]